MRVRDGGYTKKSPVSYTHLDVYKRQEVDRGDEYARCDVQCEYIVSKAV